MTSSQPVVVQQHVRQTSPVMVSRRKAEVDKLVDAEKLYEPAEAVKLLKSMATAKFVETAELHGNLNLDPKYNDQQIRTTVALPHGTGKDVRVAVTVRTADQPTTAVRLRYFPGPPRPRSPLDDHVTLTRHTFPSHDRCLPTDRRPRLRLRRALTSLAWLT